MASALTSALASGLSSEQESETTSALTSGLVSGQASSQAGPTLTEYRQLIQYQTVTDEVRAMFRGTLKQYRQWEAAQVAKNRAIMAPPEAKGKKDQKKDQKIRDSFSRAKQMTGSHATLADFEKGSLWYLEEVGLRQP